MKTILIAATLAGAMLISAQPVQAGPFLAKLGDTVIVTSAKPSSSAIATIKFKGLPGSDSQSVYSGPELLSGTFGTAKTAFENVAFYCTDLYHYSSGSVTYTVGYLTSSHQPSDDDHLTTTQINNIATLISSPLHTDQSATQLAIWEVEYGSAFSFTGTSSQITSDVKTYIDALNGSAPANVQLYQMQAPGVQGFAYVTAVPEPGTLAVLGLGLLGLSLVTRRRAA